METATIILAGGCFWCTEAVFTQLDGVIRVTCGYAGGDADDAHYEQVCSGSTNHAEAIEIEFDKTIISLNTLLDVFFHIAHDPTQLNRQGNDIGRQYRSAIFYRSAAEKEALQAAIAELLQRTTDLSPTDITTQLEPLVEFYSAEAYHQNYADRHPEQPYIFCVAKPKVAKLQQTYPHLLKH